MSKLSYNKKRKLAAELFINSGITGKAIAEQLEVATATISRWRKEDKWDDTRADLMTSPMELRKILTEELLNIAKGEKAKINSDALAKVSKVIESFNKAVSVPVIISILKEFDNWMSEQEPALAIQFLDWHKKFIIHKIEISE